MHFFFFSFVYSLFLPAFASILCVALLFFLFFFFFFVSFLFVLGGFFFHFVGCVAFFSFFFFFLLSYLNEAREQGRGGGRVQSAKNRVPSHPKPTSVFFRSFFSFGFRYF